MSELLTAYSRLVEILKFAFKYNFERQKCTRPLATGEHCHIFYIYNINLVNGMLVFTKSPKLQ